ncbi:MAG: acetylxylan esterase [Armatimonadota bacterium]
MLRCPRFVLLCLLLTGFSMVSGAAPEITATSHIEDQVKVKAKAASDDFTYWSGGPQPFYTEITNMAPGTVNGHLRLRLKSYLTKAVVRESRQRFKLIKGGAATLTWTLEQLDPGLYIAEVWAERGQERGLCCISRLVYHASAMLPLAPPADFDAFWQRTLDEQAKIPLDLQMVKVKDIGKSELYKFSFAGLLGYRCYGYLTVPQDKTKRYPALLQPPSSGLHRLVPVAFPKDDRVGMVIQISNVDVDLPDDQYDWRTWPSPYLVTGILDKEHYSLRFAYAATVRAAELLAARPEVQADNMLVAGHSEGGALSLIAAALYPKFKAVVASLPGLCRLDWNFDYLNPPYFPIAASVETRPLISRTLAYYDATQFTRRITCPVWITVGLFDDVCPSPGVFCAYNAIPGAKKTLWVQPTGGHVTGYVYEVATKGVWP